MTLRISWIDAHREAQCAANPRFPDGMDVDLSKGAQACCHAMLPYPASRCGVHRIECDTCGVKTLVTAAGRRDDPRSVRVACKAQ